MQRGQGLSLCGALFNVTARFSGGELTSHWTRHGSEVNCEETLMTRNDVYVFSLR